LAVELPLAKALIMISSRKPHLTLGILTILFLATCKPEKEEPKPLTAPVLTTMEAGDITAISAVSGGAISSDGGSPVTARGIVWGVSHNPTLADSVSEEGTGIGSFLSDLTPLKYSTTYYVRAYATNSIGTTYGNEITFNTKAAVPSDGLVGWWPFNGNANDESGNGNDGVVNGATLNYDRYGNLNGAYSFNGVDNYILLNPYSSSTLTIAIWFNPNLDIITNPNTGHPPIGAEIIGQGTQHVPTVAWSDFAFGISSYNGVNEYFSFENSSITGWTDYNLAETSLNIKDSWNLAIITISGLSLNLYLNGGLISELQLNNELLFTGAPLSIGSRYVYQAVYGKT
jgi:hypothetical protein